MSVGECHPTSTQNVRASTIFSLFKRKAMTVARPIFVKPVISVPLLSHAKCCFHACIRGLNSSTS
jgi:hypothetical protein